MGKKPVICEYRCQKCGELFVGDCSPEQQEHYLREDDVECGGIGILLGEYY